jgi:hypothetical protein
MIKKIVYFIITLCVFVSYSEAQNAESEVNLLVKNTKSVFSAVDSEQNYVFAFQTSSQFEFAFFDPNHKKTGDIIVSIPSAMRKDEYIGIQLQGDSCTVYFLNGHTRLVTQLNVRRSGQMTKRTVGQLDYTEKFLKSVYLNETFYLLTATQGRNQLDVHAVVNGAMVKNSYPVEMPDMYKRLSNGNNQLNEDPEAVLGIDRINYSLENNVKSSRATKKIYAFDNSIYLVFDDPDYTHIIHIDLEQNTSSYKQFLFNLDKGNNSSRKQGNSFLYDQILFRVTMNFDQLTFTVLNIDSNNTYANFYATPTMPINFKNGPIIQENSLDKQRVLDDNSTFFKKVLSSNLSVAVNKKDSMYIVEIGSYEEYTSNGYNNMNGGGPSFSMGMGMGSGMGMGMGGMGMGGMGMGYGGMGMGGGGMGMGYGNPYNNYGWGSPGYYNGYSGYYPYNSTATTIRTLYFHSMLDTSSYQYEEGIVPISLRERVSNFESAIFKDKKPTLVRIVDFKRQIIIGYLLPNKNIFKTYSFDK